MNPAPLMSPMPFMSSMSSMSSTTLWARRKPWIIAGSILLVLAAGWFFGPGRGRGKSGSRAPRYQEVTVERGDLRVTVLATGAVQPENRLVIKPPVDGRIEDVLVREGDRVRKGQILATMSSTDRAALVDAARSKGPDELAYWEGLYKPAPVIAPLPGVIIARNVEPGQTITRQDGVFVMSDRLIILAQVDETDLSRIQLKQKVSVVLDAYRQQEIDGEVLEIAFEARTVNNVTVYDVRIVMRKIPDFMRSGMTAAVQFLVDERANVIRIPEAAIKRKDGKTIVYVAGARRDSKDPFELSGTDSAREVKTGISDGKMTEITEGLAEGEVVLEEAIPSSDGTAGQGSPFSPFGGMGGRKRP